ncbi:hypothetical protein GCM10023322_48890 [Rugosimonospora acidiphila]|uniref:NB-ARC domain-containing protein n=1 Tax=Rugosimonospora acidiphila TaxID=556531 RepID=A0ABP9S7B9_9ACTN
MTGFGMAAVNGAAIALHAASGSAGNWPWRLDAVRTRPLAWSAGVTSAAIVASATTAGMLRWWADRKSSRAVPALQRPKGWVLSRSDEVNQVVTALTGGGRPVGPTIALEGAEGFGKTTVAKLVRTHRRVLRHFGQRVFWVTLGREVMSAAAIAEKVNDVIKLLDPGRTETFTDPRQAGEHLATLLDTGPPCLLILDDVCYPQQLVPFTAGGRQCSRLLTTRVPVALDEHGVTVPVGQLPANRARTLLTRNLPALPGDLVNALVAQTGRWPLLVRLVNAALAGQGKTGADLVEAATDLCDRLRRAGVPASGEPTEPGGGHELDVEDPGQRQRAIRAALEASLGLLTDDERARCAELAIFAENEAVPVTLAARLWRVTGGLRLPATGQLCARLDALALISLTGSGADAVIGVHGVVHDHLREILDPDRRAAVHRALLDSVAEDLPAPTPLDGAMAACGTAWWELDPSARYLWKHLVGHLVAAGRAGQAEALASDLRWVAARLVRFGPAAPHADLALLDSPRATRLAAALAQAANLLGPTDPAYAQIDILYSRVAHGPDWGPQGAALAGERRVPRLVNRWPLPDLPQPALRRTIAGHAGRVLAVAIAPDSSWLATAGDDETVRIWNVATGCARAVLTGHRGRVLAVAVAADGSWLASAGDDTTVRIWDADTGQQRAVLAGHDTAVWAVAIAPDGTWLASAGGDGTVRIWDAETGEQRAVLTGHTEWVLAVAIAPDGSWLASAGDDKTVRIWDAETGDEHATLTGHTASVWAVAIAPDGMWLASAGRDYAVRIWDSGTGDEHATLTGHNGWVWAVAIAPDGTWLASAGDDKTLRIWDAVTGEERTQLAGHTARVCAMAAGPDGTWVASAGDDETVRIWGASTGRRRAERADHRGRVSAVAIAPDGTWLASAGDDETVRIWDCFTSHQRDQLAGHSGRVWAVAIAPDGAWLASAGDDRTVRIWDAATGDQRAWLIGHTDWVRAVAIAPDGTWLASAGDDWTVRIWDAATGRQRAELTGHTAWVRAVAIAPDGTWLASAGDDWTVRIWDVATGEQRTVLTGHTDWVETVAIAPDGTWLASAGDDWTVRIWDVATGEQRAVLAGHAGRVRAVAIAPDGAWLASAGDDQTVRIWDVGSGDVHALMRVDNEAASCAWTPDGRAVAVGGTAGIYLFSFEREHKPAVRVPVSVDLRTSDEI